MAWLTNSVMADRIDPVFKARGESITYRQKSDSTNRQTGVVTASDTDTTIGSGTDADPGVLIGELSEEYIANSGGKFAFGAREFKVRNADLPESPPVRGNQIIHSGTTYVIATYNRSQDGNIWSIKCNRL